MMLVRDLPKFTSSAGGFGVWIGTQVVAGKAFNVSQYVMTLPMVFAW